MTRTDEAKDRRARKSTRHRSDQIDRTAALNAPLRIKRDGEAKAIDPYEAMLRQHVRKSLIERFPILRAK